MTSSPLCRSQVYTPRKLGFPRAWTRRSTLPLRCTSKFVEDQRFMEARTTLLRTNTATYSQGPSTRGLAVVEEKMSAVGAARSVVSIILLIIGVILLVFAAVDFLSGFGLLYALVLLVLGIIFLALSGRV